MGKFSFIDPGCSFHGCGMPGVEIESNNDSVFSSCGGKVSAVFDLGCYECVVVRIDSNTFYSIAQLNSVIVKKGQFLAKGTFIGKSKQGVEKKLYSIIFIMADNNAKSFSEKKVWGILEQSNQEECEREDIAHL